MKHDWFLAGAIIHPRMGWLVDFYRCREGYWANHGRCTAYTLGNGVSGESEPREDKVFSNFEDMYYWLSCA